MMTVRIEGDLCKGCEICVYYCPVEILVMSDETNAKGYRIVQVTNAEDCIQCRLCEFNCPDLAINIEE